MPDSMGAMFFDLEGHEFIELHNLLKITGLCHSGAAAKHAIAEGQVSVDGNVELRKRCKIRMGQSVQFNKQKIAITNKA